MLAKDVAIYVQHAKGVPIFVNSSSYLKNEGKKSVYIFSLAASWPPKPIYGTKFSLRIFIVIVKKKTWPNFPSFVSGPSEKSVSDRLKHLCARGGRIQKPLSQHPSPKFGQKNGFEGQHRFITVFFFGKKSTILWYYYIFH